MATVDGITAAKAQQIQDASVVSGYIDGSGQLILVQFDDTTIVAGQVVDNAHPTDTSTHGVGEVVGRTEPQTLTDKTLVEPVIASLINAQHDHGSAAEGGALSIGVANNPAPITSLTQFTLIDGDPVRTMASLSLQPGRWLILATCEGVTLGAATTSRFTYNISTTSPTLVGKPVSTSSDTTTINGGASLTGWLENAAVATISFTILKNGSGAQITNSTNGQLIAIRMG